MDAIWNFFNSPVGFALLWAMVAGFFVFLAGKFNPWREEWKKYEGSIITGIKLAEKQVPDDTPNAGLAKLDAALRFVLKAYAETNKGKQPSAKLTEKIKQGIQIKHADLDRFGGISKIPKVMKTAMVLLMVGALVMSGCGVPAGKDISSGTAGGNSIKLNDSHGNVIILTDGAIEPHRVIESAGSLMPVDIPTTQPATEREHE